MFSHDGRDASDRLLPSTLFLNLYPRSRIFGLLGHPPVRACGATEGSVVSRRAGPASADRAVTRRGFHPRAWSLVPFRASDPRALARSTHDYASDAPSPFDSRFRRLQVGLRGGRRIETASTTPREESGLPRSETPSFRTAPSFARSSSPRASFDDARVVHPLLVSRFAFARGKQNVRTTEVCNLERDARAKPRVELTVLSPRRTVVRCASGGRALASDPPGKATSICAVARDVSCDTPTSLYAFVAFRDRTGSCFEPVPPCHERERRMIPEHCERRRSPPLFRPAPHGSAFFRRVAERPETTS